MAAVMPVSMTIQPSTSHGNGLVIRPNLQLSSKGGVAIPYGMEVDGPGRRLRKNVANVRRHVDYVCSVINYAEQRLWQYGGRRQRLAVQPDELYQNSSLPIHRTPDVPVDCVLSKLVRAATNKIKAPIYSICWSPEGKRLITGSSNGEFTLWNGTAFNFETILQAHDSGIRAMKWSYNEQWLLSADADGYVKYWQPNMNNAHMFAAHKGESVRGIAFAPTDAKFVTAADDGTARVWDFGRCTEEKVLRGHGSEVRCVDWHPTKGLVVTGSRDTQQPVKLWDPKSGQCLSTFQEHKNSVMGVEFNRNGNWLLTGGRDHLVKVYDIRVMKELKTFRAHKKEVISVAWHPIHEGLFCSGGGDGTIVYWMMGQEKEVGLLEQAHDQAIWSMKWHPLGHILTTCSNDSSTKFWARNRPGDTTEDVYGLCSIANMVGALDKEREPKPAPRPAQMEMENEYQTNVHIPGMGLDEEIYLQINRDGISTDSAILLPDDVTRVGAGPMIGAKRTLIKQPPAKRAQKQFERMWNNSTGIGAGSDDYLMGGPTITPSMLDRRPKHMGMMGGPVTPSLLGHKPSPSLLGPRPGGPPPGGPPPQHGNFRGPPPGQGRDYNSMPPPPQQHQQQQQQQRRDFSKPPPPTPQQPQQNGGRPEDRGPPPAVPPGLKFNAQGVPMIPPGLPPHLWPMPPGKGGAPTGAPPTQPPPGQRPLDGDHDYRSGPPPPVRNQTVDVDLRAPPPTMNMQQPPPAMNRQQQPQPPLTIHAKNMNYPPPTAQSQFNHPPPNRVGPPVQQQQQQRPQWPPQQQHQQQQHQNQPAPPQPSHDPRSDPRNDPRLRQKKEENKPQPQQGWMPQFNKTDQSWR